MATWHVWGDFIHTVPERIGTAHRQDGDAAARATAKDAGFDLDRRERNGFEPWAAVFAGNGDDESQEFAFAAYPIVRGWRRVE